MSRCDKIIMDRIYAITHLYGRFEKKWYMPKFTSTGGLRGNKFYLAKMVSGLYVYMSLWYVYCELPKGQKKEIVL